MKQGQDFLYFIHTDPAAGLKFFYCDDYLNVLTTSQPKPLNTTPDGWEEISIHVNRNLQYWGFEREFTIPLNFVQDGAQIIKQIFYTQGTEAKLYLLILEQKLEVIAGKYRFYYDYLYRGEMDYNTFEHDGAKSTVNLVDGGLAAILKNSESTVVEIPMNVSANENLLLDGLKLKATQNWLSVDQIHSAANGFGAYNNLWLYLVPTQSDGTVINVIQRATTPLTKNGANSPNTDNINTDDYFFKATAATSITVRGTVTVNLTNADYVKLYIKSSTGTRTQLFKMNGPILTIGSPSSNLTQTFSFSQAFNLVANETLYLIGEVAAFITATAAAEYKEFTLSVDSISRYAPTLTKTLPVLYLLQEIVKKLSDGKYTAASNLLTGIKIQAASGDAILGVESPVIKTSLAQFFNSLNVRLNIGIGVVNNVLILEEKEYFIENPAIITLPYIANFKVKPATELKFNTVRIGSPKQTYDMLNGRDEVNSEHTYGAPVNNIKKELTLVSDYRFDAYGLEFVRSDVEARGKTTDNQSNTDVWLIKVDEFYDGVWHVDRTQNVGATGLIDPASMFNLYFSPKRCLYAWGWYIRSVLHFQDGKYLKFLTGDKNVEAVIEGIREKDDVNIGTLEARKFLPVIFEVETVVPENYQALLSQNTVRQYDFTVNGVNLQGLAFQSGMEPSSRKSQVFTFLSAPTNDLSKLIKINE